MHAFEVKMYIPVVFNCWSGAELRVMCPVCRMLAGLLFLFCGVCGVGGCRSVEKGSSGHLGIVRESVCLLGEGTGYGTARRGVTCSRFGGA